MGNLKKAKGNMYDWVTHTYSHLIGRCPHECSYCYVQAMGERFPALKARYSGDLRIDAGSLDLDYGTGRTIFIDHLNDLFADAVPVAMIKAVLEHCRKYPGNTYVFQSKNPGRMLEFADEFPAGSILGTTIESNWHHECMGFAPLICERIHGIFALKAKHAFTTFITIEPILDFDVPAFAGLIVRAAPDFVNIGADSKGTGLPEPGYEKVVQLYRLLVKKVEVRKKLNLERLCKKEVG